MDSKTHTLNLLSQKGDEVVVSWDPNDPEQVKQAEKSFAKLQKKGCIFYEVVQETGRKVGRQITQFDPNKENITARPAMAGG